MPDVDPYQAPQSIVQNDEKVAAYRHGGTFVVRRDYHAPRVCFFTGTPVSATDRPLKIFMRSGAGWITFLNIGFTVALVFYLDWETMPLWLAAIAVGSIVFVGFLLQRTRQPHFKVYCERKLRNMFRVRSVLGSLLGYAGLLWILKFDTEGFGLNFMLGFTLIIVSIFLHKMPLKFTGSQGEYEQYEGAHAKFLEQLPSKEVSFSDFVKKSG